MINDALFYLISAFILIFGVVDEKMSVLFEFWNHRILEMGR